MDIEYLERGKGRGSFQPHKVRVARVNAEISMVHHCKHEVEWGGEVRTNGVFCAGDQMGMGSGFWIRGAPTYLRPP